MKRVAVTTLLVLGVAGALVFSQKDQGPGVGLSHLSLYQSRSGQNLEALKDSISSDQVSVAQSALGNEEVINKEILKLAQNLRVDDDETYRLKELNNYRTPLNDIITRVEPFGYSQFLQETMKKILNCLPSDFCGMEKDEEDSPYFDESNTTAHKTLVRALTALELLSDRQAGIFEKIDIVVLERLLENNNSTVQQKAMALIKKSVTSDDAFELFMSNERHFSGEAKAIFYQELSGVVDKTQKLNQFEHSLSRTLEMADPDTAISVAERLGDLPIERDRLTQITQGLCRFREDASQKHNWLAVRYEIEKMKNQEKLNANFECL